MAAKKQAVDAKTELVKSAGLNAVVMDVDGLALFNSYQRYASSLPQEVVMLVDIGASVLNMVVTSGDYPEEAIQMMIDGSSEDVDKILFQPMNYINVRSVVEEKHKEIIRELKRTIDCFCEIDTGKMVQKLILSGGYARVIGLQEALQRDLSLPTELANPLMGIEFIGDDGTGPDLKDFAPMMAVGVGLALRKWGDR